LTSEVERILVASTPHPQGRRPGAGVKLQFLAGMAVAVDRRKVNLSRTFGYEGMMFSDVPNMARVFACTNSSRILKAHPESEYLCRLLNHMRVSGNPIATPLPADADITPERRIDFSSGHLERALASFLKPGSKRAWKLHQNDPKDVLLFTFASIEDSSPRRSKKGKAIGIS
jgi:hypothetical protein